MRIARFALKQTRHAIAFGDILILVALGASLEFLPAALPQWFVHTFVDGTSTRAIWAHCMGFVVGGIGTSLFVARAVRHSRVYLRTVRQKAVLAEQHYAAAVAEILAQRPVEQNA
jgi:hypothetical protein